MDTTQTRTAYRALMTACLKGRNEKPADFNSKVEGMIHEIADGEVPDYSPDSWYGAACQVAYDVYGVNFRHV